MNSIRQLILPSSRAFVVNSTVSSSKNIRYVSSVSDHLSLNNNYVEDGMMLTTTTTTTTAKAAPLRATTATHTWKRLRNIQPRRTSSVVPSLQQFHSTIPIESSKRYLSSASLSSSSSTVLHPLMELTSSEIEISATAVRAYVGVVQDTENAKKTLRFVVISLKEPNRIELDTFRSTGIAPARLAEVVAINPTTGLSCEYVVDIDQGTVISTTPLEPGVQPLFTPDDCDLAEAIVKQSTDIAKVLKERYGITDMSKVACDPWSVHLACPDDVAMTKWNTSGKPGRLVQTFLYYRQNGDGYECNHYAHPIDIVPVVDLNEQTVVTINGLDRVPAPKIPDIPINYHRNLLKDNTYLEKEWRADAARTLNITQPDGPSFTVSDDNVVTWQKWSIRVGFNYREGIVLHDIQFDGRPVMNRASLVEMAVPYADINPPYQRKCAFDVGDYGLGYCANSLELGCDCLGHIHYFDTVLPNSDGEPITKKKVICMHEEDDGILWKHVEYRNGYNESRRSRELIISSIATVVNYEYLFYWKFKQDGMIEFEIRLSGELSTNLLSASEEENNNSKPTHGVMVAPGVNAQIHQHMFCMRLDMSVDGPNNTVSEIDVVPQPYDVKTNPYGNAFVPIETILKQEQTDGIRKADPSKARYWKISSADKTNTINGKPTAYKLVPFTKGPAHPIMLLQPDSEVTKKGQFATANLWVTQYNETERFPAGEYTPQSTAGTTVGLPSWIEQNRSIEKNDIVLWHAFGVCHVPRVEDFPIMPCESTGFTLKPDNFFNGNPTIDLPPEKNVASKLASGCCSTATK